MRFTSWIIMAGLALSASAARAQHDVCNIQYTLLHYFQARCVDVAPAPGAGFRLHSVLLAKDLAQADAQETVVLLPGGPGSPAEPLKAALQEREIVNGMLAHLRVNVVMFDPRGTGLSPLPAPALNWTAREISTELAVADLRAVVDAHSPARPVILFAHSAGGHVALRFAEAHPERVKGLFLVSVSTSPRAMALLNQALMGAAPRIWEDAVRAAPATLALLAPAYLRAEDVARQQLKARLKDLNPIPNFRVLSPMVLRRQLIIHMNQDPSGASAARWLQVVDAEITRLEKEHGALVPEELRRTKLTPADLPPEWPGAKMMIQRLIMGGEGVLPAELAAESVYDGLSLRELWGDFSLAPGASPREPEPARIRAPAVFLAGGRDAVVPPAHAREFAARMPDARFVFVPEADHEFFPGQPMPVFNELEAFLKRLGP